MSDIERDEQIDNQLSDRSSFFNQKLVVFRHLLLRLVAIVSFFNLFLLIPDLVMIENTTDKISVAVIRVVYTVILFIIAYKSKSIKSFKLLSIIISICELASAAIFLFIFSMYPNPSFLIQAMGIIILIIIVFIIPNRWIYMLFVALTEAAGFFICASFFVKSIDITEFAAALVYISITIYLCAISARDSEKHQFNEFVARNELERISMTDYLTDTANRLKIIRDAERWIDFCKRHDLPLSLVFADIDNLKSINDQFGHSAGDNVLKNLAALMQKQLRSSDILARWGGDEFIIFLPSVSLDNAIALSKRIGLSVKENIEANGNKITCSFGVAEMSETSTFDSLVREADELMYIAKKHGKDIVLSSKSIKNL